MAGSPSNAGGNDAAGGRTTAGALIDERFQINFAQRLPALDSPNAEAFAATDHENEGRRCFALLCNPSIPNRAEIATRLALVRSPNLISVHAFAAAAAPGAPGRRMAFILQQPSGERLHPTKGKAKALDEATILERVLPGLLNALNALHERGLPHRAIRPSNIFLDRAGRQGATLGECLSAPPGFDQPALFEPIERAAARPAGRGAGTPACDMHALGMTMAALLLGGLPPSERPLDELRDRVERQTFSLIAPLLVCSDALRDLLAGLLVDDPSQRWSIEDLRAWTAGRRSSPPARRSRDGMRPYTFLRHEYKSPKALAHAFANNSGAAQGALREGRLAAWIRRSYGDRTRSEAITALIGRPEDMREGLTVIDDEVVASVTLVLDPEGPVRYRDQAVMLDGIGPALAHAMLSNDAEGVKTIKRILGVGLPLRALGEDEGDGAQRERENLFRTLMGFAKETNAETGIERCTYELNPSLHCLSPLVVDAHVTALDELASALDALAKGGQPPRGSPRDRHVAAFIASRLPLSERQRVIARMRGAPPDAADGLADLALMSAIQRHASCGPLPGLARWLEAPLGKAVDSFYSRSRREKMKAALQEATRAGDLNGMLRAASGARERSLDQRQYRVAEKRRAALSAEIARLKTMIARRHQLAIVRGRRVSVSLAVIVLLIACASAAGGIRL